ncbi:hypothetical protein, partial [Aetokthonos hydrillicola]|uniref:hypothetical protein n=1 Tax=Aetokthonos hydrillicola TaxID=1550245 RepID=UPI001ABA2D0A
MSILKFCQTLKLLYLEQTIQKEIWIKTGNRLGIKLEQWNGEDYKNYIRFSQAVGWLDDKG